MKTLAAEELEFPRFELGDAKDGEVFALSSHKRARDALELGMRIEGNGSNIFVIGEDRSGRLTSTISIVERFAATARTPDDWVYLQCFGKPSRPRAYRLTPTKREL
jgi:hypothetical protein